MKTLKQILPIVIFTALIYCNTACDKTSSKGNNDSKTSIISNTINISSTDNSGNVLPTLPTPLYGLTIDINEFYCNPNYDINLDSLSFEELRLLRSIPYARNGQWFKEGEICEKLNTIGQYVQDLKPIVKQYAQDKLNDKKSKYWETWFNNYPETYDLICLNDDETAFVKRVDNRIAELEKDKHVIVDGIVLPNAKLLYNRSYVDISDAKFWENLQKQNFAISNDQYDQLFNPYELYDNLPVYVTTDLYLHTYHMYFSWLLKRLETKHFLPSIKNLCTDLYKSSLQYIDSAQNVDEKKLAEFAATFYAIAIKLATDEDVAPMPESIKNNYDNELANIMGEVDANSSFMSIDDLVFPYSLFKPRGNYTRTEEGKRYFKCMMWLQTARLSLRESLFLAYQFNQSSNETKDTYYSVCDAITFIMGEPDNVSIAQISDILDKELGIKFVKDICQIDLDNAMEKVFLITIPKLRSVNLKFDKLDEPTKNFITMNSANTDYTIVNFMPQRYVPDNEILGTMYDSVPNANRAYPCGLDVFDAFGSSTAANILDSTDNYAKEWNRYDAKRKQMRKKFSEYGNYDQTMYNKWLESLITLQKKDKSLPGHMKTSAWEKKNINSSLGSWAELKHDAILYAKQPWGAEMGGGDDDYYPISLPSPEYFQNYLEPNIQFWEKLKEVLDLNVSILKRIGYYDDIIEKRTNDLIYEVNFCINVSNKELNNIKLTETEDYTLERIGGTFEYKTLHLLESDDNSWLESWHDISGPDTCIAIIADVFTRGVENCSKNGILYVASAKANTIYVIVERNNQTYLTRGAVYDYREFVGPMGNRLTDEEWQISLGKEKNAGNRPAWMSDLYTKKKIRINKKAGDRDMPFWLIHYYYDEELNETRQELTDIYNTWW